jgi:hypothetical protein
LGLPWPFLESSPLAFWRQWMEWAVNSWFCQVCPKWHTHMAESTLAVIGMGCEQLILPGVASVDLSGHTWQNWLWWHTWQNPPSNSSCVKMGVLTHSQNWCRKSPPLPPPLFF